MLLDAPLPEIGEHVEETEVDTEMLRIAEEYADYVRSFLAPDSQLLVEEKFDLSFIAPNTFGTSDTTVLVDGHLHVMDLKTGQLIVYAEENTQLMLYALGALEHFKDEFIEEVTLHIVQTRVGHISTWTTTVERLEEFRNFAHTQAMKIISDEVEFSPSDKACQWCLHKAKCETLATYVEDIVRGEFDDLDAIDGKADSVLPAHMTRILENESLIISFIKAVKDKALEELQNGNDVDGFKLVRSKKHKRWIDKDKAEAYLLRKLKKAGTFKQTLITPAQAIKAVGKDNAQHLEKMIEIPEGDIVLAPESDKRESVTAICDEFDEL
jgi:hypothetical protein